MDEDLIFSIHPSMRLPQFLYASAAALIILAGAALFFGLFPVGGSAYLLPASLGSIGIALLIFAGAAHVQRNCTTYILTGRELRIVNRMIGENESIIPLSKIQDVKFSCSALQSFFNLGDIYIATADEHTSGDAVMLNIDSPAEHKEDIVKAMGNISGSLSD